MAARKKEYETLLLQRPVTSSQDLIQRINLLEGSNRALSSYLERTGTYQSPFYSYNLTRLTQWITAAHRQKGDEDFGGPAESTNGLLFALIFQQVNHQLKIVTIGRITP